MTQAQWWWSGNYPCVIFVFPSVKLSLLDFVGSPSVFSLVIWARSVPPVTLPLFRHTSLLTEEILGNKTIRSEWDVMRCVTSLVHYTLHYIYKTDCIGRMRAALAASLLWWLEMSFYFYHCVNLLREHTFQGFLSLHNKQCILACSSDHWMKDCIRSINTLFYCFLVPFRGD